MQCFREVTFQEWAGPEDNRNYMKKSDKEMQFSVKCRIAIHVLRLQNEAWM